LSEGVAIVIIDRVPQASARQLTQSAIPPDAARSERALVARAEWVWKSGQVAQVVERSPEKAGVGGSTPSLATMFSITCKQPKTYSFSRANYARTSVWTFAVSQGRGNISLGCSISFQISRAVEPVRAMCLRASFA
jgi:hypothetical protein